MWPQAKPALVCSTILAFALCRCWPALVGIVAPAHLNPLSVVGEVTIVILLRKIVSLVSTLWSRASLPFLSCGVSLLTCSIGNCSWRFLSVSSQEESGRCGQLTRPKVALLDGCREASRPWVMFLVSMLWVCSKLSAYSFKMFTPHPAVSTANESPGLVPELGDKSCGWTLSRRPTSLPDMRPPTTLRCGSSAMNDTKCGSHLDLAVLSFATLLWPR